MLRDRRSSDVEMARDLPRRAFGVPDETQDLSPPRLGQGSDGVFHRPPYLRDDLRKCQLNRRPAVASRRRSEGPQSPRSVSAPPCAGSAALSRYATARASRSSSSPSVRPALAATLARSVEAICAA